MFVGVSLAALFIGFLAGLLAFKVKRRWCRECGATLQCLECKANLHRPSQHLS